MTTKLVTKINLISPIAKLRLCLAPPHQAVTPGGALREVPGTRKQLTFNMGRAVMPAEWLELLEEHPAFTGAGQRKIVFLEDDPQAPIAQQHGVRVVDGAISSDSSKQAEPPVPGWNQLAPERIKEMITLGLVDDPLDAINYETKHLRRQSVLFALMDAAKREMEGGAVTDRLKLEEAGPQPRTIVPSGQEVE